MAKVTRLSLDNGGGQDRRRLHLREISDAADSPLETVGQDLRNARQRKGEDLAQISRILKIRKDYLDSLEESRFEALPGRAYAIGFVRTYAEYLGLDHAQCVERLKAEIAGRDEARESAVALTPAGERKLPQGGYILIAVLLIVLVYTGYYLIDSTHRFGSIPVTPVPARLAGDAGSPPLVPAASIPPPNQTAAPAAASVSDTPAPAAAPQTNPPVAAPAAKPLAAASAPPAPVEAPLPPGIKYGAQNQNSRITLRVHRPMRVTVLGPGNRLFLDRSLQPGDTYMLPNVPGLTLSTTDGGAVEMILDGGSVGYAAKDGAATKGMSLNPQDIVDREQHP